MASPPHKTLQSFSGKWQLNKSCSDDFASVLALQGVNFIVRKAASAASIHLKINQPDEQHIEMAQSWRTNKDDFFGDVAGRSRSIDVEEGKKAEVVGADNAPWIEGDSEGQLIEAEGKREDVTLVARHLWGFEVVEGERRHTRRVYVKNDKGEELRVRMVYDFVGE
ncbi:hypothetical protein EK21DRAFT_96858 [Setomelanomma holmii]|uniref:Uncharacterized protein n=1 Tax=Setomelanomma holmii TaxID=210430 RepID=A0A9P4HLA3_9PLEO|nr:hypothetical protein EK21DRAFT_96858 [Setomelanomma holmii]